MDDKLTMVLHPEDVANFTGENKEEAIERRTHEEEALPEADETKPEPPNPKQLSYKEHKALLRQYFTVRRPTVVSCGHKINIENDPRNNCPDCWFAYFQTNGQMTQTADEIFQKEGQELLERVRGKKFTKMFLRFMATIALLQQQLELEAQLKEKNVETGNSNSDSQREDGFVQGTPVSGGETKQAAEDNSLAG